MNNGNKNQEKNKGPASSKDCSLTEKKYVFYRKPSLKKKGPEVKQTKASMIRMLKANPLLKYELEGKEVPVVVKPLTQSQEKPYLQPMDKEAPAKDTIKHIPTKQFKKPGTKRIGSIITGNSTEALNKKSDISTCLKQSTIEFNISSPRILSSTRTEPSGNSSNCKGKPLHKTITKSLSRPVKNKETSQKQHTGRKSTKKTENPIRRSLSAQHFERKKGLSRTDSEKFLSKAQHTQSTGDLINIQEPHHHISPIAEASRETSLVFKTPGNDRRSTTLFTPLSAASARRSMYCPKTPLPSLNDLQKRLNEWLTKRGKNITMFHNLKSFDTLESIEENKENIEVNQDLDKGSYEDLHIPEDSNKDDMQKNFSENVETVAKAALTDLLNLIQEGYPASHCEVWLQLIKDKYSQLQKEPEYWECRAAIEESRGNISKAVECYKTAIVQGAEVKEVDKSLDVLLQKFSLLNINPDNTQTENISKERARIITDARHIFKSSIIKFAVQEKKLKRNNTESGSELTFVATPVRRSTRLSRSAYTSTPGLQICSSLKNFDVPEMATLDFKHNKALH